MAQIVKVKTATEYGKPWEVRWSWYDANGQRHFKQERFRTDREAKAKQREVEDQVAAANLPDYAAGRKALSHWAERWYDGKATRTKPTTAHGYRTILDASVLPKFGSAQVRAITTADIQEWVDKMTQAPPTIKHHFHVLRAVLSHAVKGRAIRDNPARDVELPTDRSTGRMKSAAVFLEPEQIERLAEALVAHTPYDLLVRFVAYTGLRASEVAGLNIADVDLLHSRLNVTRTRNAINGEHTPKSGESRKVPLSPWLRDDLAEYLNAHPRRSEPDAPLWPARKLVPRPGGQCGAMDWSRPYSHAAFYRRLWKPALAEAGLIGVRFHDLRHTYASLMAREGVPPYRVAKYMGHKDATITLAIYTHLWEGDADDDAARLARPAHVQPSSSAARFRAST